MSAAGIAMMPVGAAAYVLGKVYGWPVALIPAAVWGVAAAILVGRYVRSYRHCPVCDGPTKFASFGLSNFQLYDCPACSIRWDTKVALPPSE